MHRTTTPKSAGAFGILYRSSNTGRIAGQYLTRALVLVILLGSSAAAQGNITTVAGGGPTNISALSVTMEPYGVAVDSAGNVLVASEAGIFRVDPSGLLTSVGDGCGGPVCWALAVAVAKSGAIYAADLEKNRVLKIDKDGASSTVGGGDAGAHPPTALAWSVAVDGDGSVYIADAGAHRVRKVDASGVETTVAGIGTAGFSGDAGPATSAMLNSPSGVAVDGAGILYIADIANMRIRRVDRNGVISTVAGNGRQGFSGDGGPATRARLWPNRVAVDRSGALYIADTGNNRVRKVDTRGIITTVAGNGRAGFGGDGGPATRASLDEPWDVAVSDQGTLYIADPHNGRIRAVAPNGVITTVAGSSSDDEFTGDGGQATSAVLSLTYLHPIALDSAGALYIVERFGGIRKVGRDGIITRMGGVSVHDEGSISGVAVDSSGAIYVATTGRIRRIDTRGAITLVAGNGTFRAGGDGGPATSAGMSISDLAVDRTGALFIAGDNRVRKIDLNGIISTVAGNGTDGASGDGGPATRASVGNPSAVAVDGDGVLYIAQRGRIRKVDRDGVISTVAGNGTAGFTGDGGPATSASLDRPVAVAVDGSGNIYIAEMGHRVRRVDAGGIITTVAGNGTAGFAGDGGPGTAARLNSPAALAVTNGGTLFIADWGNQRVRMLVGRR